MSGNVITEDEARILQENLDGYVADGFIMSRASLNVIQKLLDANVPNGRLRVDIEHIEHLKDELRRINNWPIDDIDFYYQNQPVGFCEKALDDFKFMGLNNADIITCFEFSKK